MFKAPKDTTINPREFIPEKGVLPFAPELIQFIVAGEKLTTYRYGDKYDYLKPGDIVSLQNSDTKKIIGKAEVVDKSQLTFAELPLKTSGHETYKNKGHQRKVLSGYYAYLKRELRDNDVFLKLEFKLLDQE